MAALVLLLLGPLLSACWGSDTGSREAAATDWGPAPVQVDGTTVLAQSDGDGFRLHTASGDKEFLPGVNLGSTTPLHQPGEVGQIEAEQYRTWFAQMAEMGIRVVRIYTLHPPAFYDELAAWNQAHPQAPIYLVQGAYLPDESYVEGDGTLYDPEVDDAFSTELAHLSDAVHGDFQRAAEPGRAGGEWTTDVSPWLVSWIIGVEWDPFGVRRTDRQHAGAAYEPGRYFAATDEASPTERWLATHLEELAVREAERGVSVPMAFVNWPTTDPLDHPTEPSPNEDLVAVDPTHVLPTRAWPGGTFASYHAYPYFPDFQRDEPGLDDVSWRGEPDRYGGYLTRLRDQLEGTMPLLVTEFGVPSSLGSAHEGPRDRDQGGHTEQDAMATDADLMRLIADLDLGGAFVFSWEDEWFKRTWNTQLHQVAERRQLWHDPLTNEQWFGIVATDPDPLVDAAVEDVPESGAYEYVYTWADASWVHLELTFRDEIPARVQVDADVLPGLAGPDHRIVVDTEAGTAAVEVRRELDPIRLDTTVRPYRPDEDAPWHPFQLLVNQESRTPDGSTRPAEYQEVGLLRAGVWDPASPDHDSLSTWRVDPERRQLQLRIPWSMLGMADPSSRTALGEGVPAEMVTIDGIDLTFDADGEQLEQRFVWPEWNHTTYAARVKAGADALGEAFTELAP